jgi:Uncharacterized protein with a bacterial SH3 domain homologue
MSRKNRGRYKGRWRRIWPWISFIVFLFVASLLGYSIYKKESPTKVLSDLIDGGQTGIASMSRSELRSLAVLQRDSLSTLKSDLYQCQNNNGLRRAIITVSASTLNMRADPSLSGEIILRIPTGSSVNILYYDERKLFLEGSMGQWCRIRYADKEGWVWGNYIELIED